MDLHSISLTALKEQMLQNLQLMITGHFSMVYDDMVRRIQSNLNNQVINMKDRETKLLQQQEQEMKGQVSNLTGISPQKFYGRVIEKVLRLQVLSKQNLQFGSNSV